MSTFERMDNAHSIFNEELGDALENAGLQDQFKSCLWGHTRQVLYIYEVLDPSELFVMGSSAVHGMLVEQSGRWFCFVNEGDLYDAEKFNFQQWHTGQEFKIDLGP